jgi:hypothetical protein
MGIRLGCQVLSRVVDSLFGDLKHKFVYNFMDDLVVYSGSFDEHLRHLKKFFMRLEKAGFTLNRDKLHLDQREISFFGHSVSGQAVQVLPERIELIRNFPLPKNLKAVRRFLGIVGFYARFIERLSQISEPLHALKRKNARFVWGEAQQAVFERLKDALSTPPVLQIPDFSREFTLFAMLVRLLLRPSFIRRRDRGWPRPPLVAVCCHPPKGSTLFTRKSAWP